MAKQVIHGDIEGHRDPPQRTGTRETGLTALNLVEGRPRNLRAAGKLIRPPTLGVAEISHALSQSNHEFFLTVEVLDCGSIRNTTERRLDPRSTLLFMRSQKASWRYSKIYKTFVYPSSPAQQ